MGGDGTGHGRGGMKWARRWAWHLLVALVTAVLAFLGIWQLDRHEELQEKNALLVERLAAEPRPYEALTSELDPDAPEGDAANAAHRPVIVTGRFDDEHEVLLRGRTFEGRPGYHVLTPLILDGDGEGRAVLVDRGWVPYRVDDPALPSYAPPKGTVRVRGRLMPEADPPEGFLAGLAPRDPPTGELEVVARADADRLQGQIPYTLDSYLIEAESIESVAGPAASDAGGEDAGNGGTEGGEVGDALLPIVPPPPGPEPGPHVGYAVQWFAFALTAAIGYLILIRRA